MPWTIRRGRWHPAAADHLTVVGPPICQRFPSRASFSHRSKRPLIMTFWGFWFVWRSWGWPRSTTKGLVFCHDFNVLDQVVLHPVAGQICFPAIIGHGWNNFKAQVVVDHDLRLSGCIFASYSSIGFRRSDLLDGSDNLDPTTVLVLPEVTGSTLVRFLECNKKRFKEQFRSGLALSGSLYRARRMLLKNSTG